MKISDVKIIFELIKEASHVHIIIISFLVFPFVLDSWLSVFSQLDEMKGKEFSALIVIFSFLGVLLMLAVSNDKKNKELDLIKCQVINYLIANNFTRVSFDKFREKHYIDTGNDKFSAVIAAYPTQLRLASISVKGRNGKKLIGEDSEVLTKPGFGIVDA